MASKDNGCKQKQVANNIVRKGAKKHPTYRESGNTDFTHLNKK